VLFICVFLPFSGYLFIFRRWSQFSIPNHAAAAAAATTTAAAAAASCYLLPALSRHFVQIGAHIFSSSFHFNFHLPPATPPPPLQSSSPRPVLLPLPAASSQYSHSYWLTSPRKEMLIPKCLQFRFDELTPDQFTTSHAITSKKGLLAYRVFL